MEWISLTRSKRCRPRGKDTTTTFRSTRLSWKALESYPNRQHPASRKISPPRLTSRLRQGFGEARLSRLRRRRRLPDGESPRVVRNTPLSFWTWMPDAGSWMLIFPAHRNHHFRDPFDRKWRRSMTLCRFPWPAEHVPELVQAYGGRVRPPAGPAKSPMMVFRGAGYTKYSGS